MILLLYFSVFQNNKLCHFRLIKKKEKLFLFPSSTIYLVDYPCLFLPRRLHQQFESYKEQVRKIGEEARRYQGEHKDDAPTCGICRKTKFADGCGHLCSYCRTRFCARCGGRVSLRSNSVSKKAGSARRHRCAWGAAGSVTLGRAPPLS